MQRLQGYMDYSKLWKLLKERGLSTQYLRDNGISPNTITKMRRYENVNTDTLVAICSLLNVQPRSIMNFVPTRKPRFKKGGRKALPPRPHILELPNLELKELPKL